MAAEPAGGLAEILEKLPTGDYQTAGRLCERLLAGGPALILVPAALLIFPSNWRSDYTSPWSPPTAESS